MARVLILLANGFEELEAITVMDLLSRANIEFLRASLDKGYVTAAHHTVLVPDCTLDEVMGNDFDLIVIPGGKAGVEHLIEDHRVTKVIHQQVQQDKMTAAICAGPAVLVKAEVTDDKTITCYPGALDGIDLGSTSLSNESVVIDWPLITSRGPGTAIEFSLQLIECLSGAKVRERVRASLAGD
ncbi:MAG: DJ-1 family protein [Alteromonadaceae bacterium]|nr:MAG: DJ-1 family protein [Alteromonadaceae bacterium]